VRLRKTLIEIALAQSLLVVLTGIDFERVQLSGSASAAIPMATAHRNCALHKIFRGLRDPASSKRVLNGAK
jgi:hypothetical protein